MALTNHRLLVLLAAILAALALATPALASEEDDDDDEDDSPPVVQPAPLPVAPVPAPAAPPAPPAPRLESSPRVTSGGGEVEGEKKTKRTLQRQITRTRTRTVHAKRTFAVQTVPRGGVQAGAGGMAPDGPDGGLLGFAAGSLVLLAGGGLIARGRRHDA